MARTTLPSHAAVHFWQERGGMDLAAAHLLPGGKALEVRFRGGQSYRLEAAALGLEGRLLLATLGTDPRAVVVARAGGGMVDVPVTAILALTEPAYRAALTRKADTVGARVRALRQASGRTAMAVAEAAGMARSNFARLEAGTHEPRLSTLRRVAEALGVPLDALIG